jgi:hypothetical protein
MSLFIHLKIANSLFCNIGIGHHHSDGYDSSKNDKRSTDSSDKGSLPLENSFKKNNLIRK